MKFCAHICSLSTSDLTHNKDVEDTVAASVTLRRGLAPSCVCNCLSSLIYKERVRDSGNRWHIHKNIWACHKKARLLFFQSSGWSMTIGKESRTGVKTSSEGTRWEILRKMKSWRIIVQKTLFLISFFYYFFVVFNVVVLIWPHLSLGVTWGAVFQDYPNLPVSNESLCSFKGSWTAVSMFILSCFDDPKKKKDWSLWDGDANWQKSTWSIINTASYTRHPTLHCTPPRLCAAWRECL